MATTSKATSTKKPAATAAKKTTATKAPAKAAPKAPAKSTKSTEEEVLSTKPTGKTGKMEDSEFHEFFVDELKAATSPELAAAFEKHTVETKTHIETLEKVFELLEEKAQAKKCDAMEGLLAEADSIIEDTDSGTLVRDAGLILAAQKVEHYEIATYGTLRVFAENMGHTDVVELLSQTLEDEKATDIALTQIAEGFVNQQAASE
jgi:ferritin-like metal-binding protein YciE